MKGIGKKKVGDDDEEKCIDCVFYHDGCDVIITILFCSKQSSSVQGV